MSAAFDVLCNICDVNNLENEALDAFCNNNLGELFIEYREDEVLRIEQGVVQTPSFNVRRGFGLRSFKDDVVRYAHSSCLDAKSVKLAVSAVAECNITPNPIEITNACSENHLYDSAKFINTVSLDDKINFLKTADAYARSKSDKIRQVVAVLASSWQVVSILDDSGNRVCDIRPLVRFTVSVILEHDGKLESGMYSGGGRCGYSDIVNDLMLKNAVDESIRQAEVKIIAKHAPAGEMPVVLGNGWTGILLHEAIGHGLEGDSIRKKTSSFHSLLGTKIASDNVTVVDDGRIAKRRGSLNVDDEGTQTNRTTLIENGKLVGFLQDRMNSKLMGVNNTGNGRRENYTHAPIARMTNTIMLNGNNSFDEMISSVKTGVFAKTFSDGQVDVASGKFVFSSSEAYMIENGKITYPIKGAMLIGDGPSILKKISMIGDDFAMDNGTGTCGKDGQWVPVGVGQPSVLIDKITIGGAQL